VAGGEYSAKYHAQAAATSASNASTSAGTATTQATNASTSASTASTQAGNASSSASAAASSATSAAASATEAAGYAASVNPSSFIAKSIVDAKGDLIVATGSDTVARVAVGTNTHVLTADSAEASGVKWAAVSGLPSQTGNTGKYLTTDGSTASWAAVTTDPTPTVFLLMGA
jgi:hypothetical protein